MASNKFNLQNIFSIIIILVLSIFVFQTVNNRNVLSGEIFIKPMANIYCRQLIVNHPQSANNSVTSARTR